MTASSPEVLPATRFDSARRRMVVAAVVAAVLGIGAGVLLGRQLGVPRDDSAEAGFARDMATHHAQAVDMSLLIRDTSSDPELRTLAADILVTQSTQRGVFMGWLQQWGLSQASPGPRMAWMPGHAPAGRAGGGVALMHGMASDAELRRLQQATGVDADVLFLELMIRHHEGGVVMARALLERSHRDEVVQMARQIEEGQRAEIAQMREMLAVRTAAGSR